MRTARVCQSAAGVRVVASLIGVLVLAGCGDAQGQGGEIVVSGSVPEERVGAYEELTATALAQVEALWGPDAVQRPVEVLLPATPAEFAELTGGAAASQEAPAVTVGRMAEAHVVVHPDSWGRLTAAGRQAVLTHEVTHLAMQGDGAVPPWLGEGLAEYTAHRGSGLAPAQVAGSALDGVRAGQLPSDWPDLKGSESAWESYALSWLACLYLAQTWSEQALLDLYDEIAGGTPVGEALPAVLGVSEEEALAGWRTWLTTL